MRVAVLGLGSAGARHTASLATAGADVIGWDPDPAREASGAERAETAAAALDAADAAVVASPNAAHAEQALAALERGLPTLVEKPLAVTAADAEAVAAAAAERGVLCAVAMNLRFHPAVAALRSLLADGELGELRCAAAWFGYDLRKWRPADDYRRSYSARADLGGGIVLDAIHELDYLAWLAGPVQSVTAETARVSDLEIDVEDTAIAGLRFASGAVGMLDLNFHEAAYRRGCLLVGERATARWDWTAGRIEVAAGEERRELVVAADVADTYFAEIEDFLAAAAGERAPMTSAAEGAAAVRLAEAIKRSAADGARVELG